MSLDKLPPKRRAFVLAYTGEAQGNATKAATIAGYKKPRREGSFLLTIPDIMSAVETERQKVEKLSIMGREERQRRLTEIARGQDPEGRVSDSLKAVELLGKMQGDYLDRVQHEGNVGAQLVIVNNGRGPMPEG